MSAPPPNPYPSPWSTWPPLGSELAAQRVAAGLSQRDLAALAGVHRSTVAGLEAGRRDAPWPRAALGAAIDRAAGRPTSGSMPVRTAAAPRARRAQPQPVTDDVLQETSETDENLAAAAKRGDTAAFEALYVRYRRMITTRCQSVLGRYGTAEDTYDLTQDTFLKAYVALPQAPMAFRGQQFGHWLYKIATNVCLDAVRHRKLLRWYDLDAPAALLKARVGHRSGHHVTDSLVEVLWDRHADAPGEAALQAEVQAEVQRVLAQVTPAVGQRCLVAHVVHGTSLDDLAAAEGKTISAIKSMLTRARIQFRRRWEAEGLPHPREVAACLG